jgi:hypothetical protein
MDKAKIDKMSGSSSIYTSTETAILTTRQTSKSPKCTSLCKQSGSRSWKITIQSSRPPSERTPPSKSRCKKKKRIMIPLSIPSFRPSSGLELEISLVYSFEATRYHPMTVGRWPTLCSGLGCAQSTAHQSALDRGPM